MKPATRFISALLTLCMVISLMPQTALFAHAAEESDTAPVQVPSKVITAPMTAAPAFEELPPATEAVDEPVATASTEEFTYSVDANGNVTITGYTGAESVVEVPASIDGHPVTAIGSNAFNNKDTLTEIKLPDAVTFIGYRAFHNCDNLSKINYPLSLKTVDREILTNCPKLKTFAFPDELTTVLPFIRGAAWLESVTLPSKLETISTDAFNYCVALKSIDIPNSVTSIGSHAFNNCDSLTEIKLPDAVTFIGYRAFHHMDILENINYPRSLETVDREILTDCPKLKTFVFPDELTTVLPFIRGAAWLESVTLPSKLETISADAFNYCVALKSIDIPNSVTSIGSHAFNNCDSLTEIILPDAVTFIGYRAFHHMDILENINYPRSLETVDREILTDCPKLKTFVFPDELTTILPFIRGAAWLESVTLPSKLETISADAFNYCVALKSIDIPNSVTSIGSHAFNNCDSLTEIKLPDAVTFIGYRAFHHMDILENINYPRSLETVDREILTDCPKLKTFVFPDELTTIAPILNRVSSVETVTLPSKLTAIPESCFGGCVALQSVDIPDSVTSIGRFAFGECRSLKKLHLPDSITHIGYRAFQICDSLTEINYPRGLTSVGDEVFINCPKLKTFVFPDELTTILPILNRAASIETVTLPSKLTAIPDSCFGGCAALQSVDIPDTVTSIGKFAFGECKSLESVALPEALTYVGYRAFQICPNLKSINIPKNVTSTGGEVFLNSPNVTIYCDYMTPTLMGFIENGSHFVTTGSFVDSDDLSLDRKDTYLYTNLKGATAGGFVPVTIRYAIKDSWKNNAAVNSVRIVLPVGSDLDESTLKLNGVLCTDNYNYDGNRIITVYTKELSGEIKFSVNAEYVQQFSGYAAVDMRKDGKNTRELLALFSESVNLLTLNAPEMVGTATFDISGIAPAEEKIVFSVNGEEVTSATATKGGSWNASITLTDPKDYHPYVLTAVCGDMTQTVKIVYHTDEATVTGFTMYYNEHNVIKSTDLLSNSNVKPTVYFLPDTQFDFEVKFDHPEQIDKLYVTSTRNNQKLYLEAQYDEEKGAFVTDGFFNPDDTRYVPGVLNVEYTKKVETHTVTNDMDWSVILGYTANVPEDTIQRIETGAQNVSATFDMSKFHSDLAGIVIDTSIQVYDEATDGNLNDWIGEFETMSKYVLPGENGESYLMSMDYSDPETYVILIKDATGSKIVKYIIDAKIDSADSMQEIAKLTDCADTLSNVNLVASIILNQMQITEDMDNLRDEVMAIQYDTPNGRTEALKKVDELEMDQRCFSLMTTMLPLLIVAGAPMAGPALVFSGMIAMIGAMAPMFWQMRTMNIKGQGRRVNFVIDPSGYVYDIDTEERLEGVKTTAYCIIYDETDDFWDKVPAENEYGKLWDASEYDQANPLFTNADGKYAWDVPEGWWRVKYEKDGYETTWSEWMTVPPVQTEVNIGMKNLKPVVTPTPTPTPVPENPFEDVMETDWFYLPVMWAVQNNVTGGTSPTTFSPNAFCTRAQVVTFLWAANGKPEPAASNNPFSDVQESDWYFKAVMWAVENKITGGTSPTTFSPDAFCTRAQVATFLYAAQGKPTVKTTENTFTDVPDNAWYLMPVLWALENGVTGGIAPGQFGPDNTCTRAQIATFLYKAIGTN